MPPLRCTRWSRWITAFSRRTLAPVILVALLLLPSPVRADDPRTSQPLPRAIYETDPSEPKRIPPRHTAKLPAKPDAASSTSHRQRSSASGWWTSAGALVAVVLLILGSARLLRKHLPAGQSMLPGEACQVLGKRHLDPRQSIIFVRCGARILILGSGPNGLTLLAEITDPVEIDQLAGLCLQAQPNAATQSFSQLLGHFRPGVEHDEHAGPDADLAAERFKDRLARASTSPATASLTAEESHA